jgi:O-antigen ligase
VSSSLAVAGAGYQPAAERPSLSQLGWHLVSFEAVFVLSIYMNMIEVMLDIKSNLAPGFILLSILFTPLVIWRDGIPARGLLPFAAGLAFVAWAALSFTWTPSRVVAPGKLFWLSTLYPWYLVVGTFIIGCNPVRLVRFIVFMLVLGGFLAAAGVSVYLTYGSFQRLPIWDDRARVYLVWGRSAAYSLAISFLLGIYSRWFSLRQLACFATAGICVFFLLVGGGRSALIAGILGCLPPLLIGLHVTRKRLFLSRGQLLALVLLAAAAALLAYLITSGEATATLKRLESLFSDMTNEDAVMRGPNRFDYYSSAFNLWLQAPILGHGIGGFPRMHGVMVESAQGSYPHNFILEIMVELGIVGLALFLFFVWTVAKDVSVARLRREPVLLCVVMLCVVAGFTAMTSFDLIGNRIVILTLCFLLVPPPPAEAADVPDDGTSRSAAAS